MDKVIRDGKVAVVYHSSWGAGWYTWHGVEELLFSPRIVDMIESGASQEEFEEYVKTFGELMADAYLIEELAIRWVDSGVEFWIEEYDGSETVMLKGEYKWITA